MITNDPLRLKQVLVNLVSNGLKFTDCGSVKLAILPAPDDVNNEALLITVTDTGSGMQPEDLDSIFEAFRQVDQSHSRKHSGTGLGLAIVDAIVDLMEGRIWVESKLQVGTTFYIQIPRVVTKQL